MQFPVNQVFLFLFIMGNNSIVPEMQVFEIENSRKPLSHFLEENAPKSIP